MEFEFPLLRRLSRSTPNMPIHIHIRFADTTQTLPTAPTALLDRVARSEWWATHRLDSPGDILQYGRLCQQLDPNNETNAHQSDTGGPSQPGILYRGRIPPHLRRE
jgi:hypothetical protein